jgi:hypothetical protein
MSAVYPVPGVGVGMGHPVYDISQASETRNGPQIVILGLHGATRDERRGGRSDDRDDHR